MFLFHNNYNNDALFYHATKLRVYEIKKDFANNLSFDLYEWAKSVLTQLDELSEKIQGLNAVSNGTQNSVMDAHSIDALKSEIQELLVVFTRAKSQAEELERLYANNVQILSDIIMTEGLNRYKTGDGALFSQDTFSVFEKVRQVGALTWSYIRPMLKNSQNNSILEELKQNALAQLIMAEDVELVDSIDCDQILFEGEVGFLLFNRMKDIHASQSSTRHMKQVVGRKMRQILPLNAVESLLHYNRSQYVDEVTKLIVHAHYHSDKKMIWLGTARAVNAVIKEYYGDGMYLNPSNPFFSWMLNRGWLQAAVHLGYRFQLVEQHFPSIEKALMTQNPGQFLMALVSEMREESNNKCSQYNGNYSCTATTQEILALMDLGCNVQRNDDYNTLFLVPKQKSYEEGYAFAHVDRYHSLRRCHSYIADSRKVSTPPPYESRMEHFTLPDTGEVVTFGKVKY